MNDTPKLMFDIESLSTKPNALILSIGAVYIDPEHGINMTMVAPKLFFYQVINRQCQSERHIDVGTVEWWMEHQDVYPRAIPNSMLLTDALYSLNSWITSVIAWCKYSAGQFEFWAKGTDFDFVVLRNAYESLGIPVPWPYNSIRDLRTLLKAVPKDCYTPKEANPELHDALGDAKFQARQLMEALEWMKQEKLAS